MKGEMIDIDKIMVDTSEIGNRLYRMILRKIMHQGKGENKARWKVENKDEMGDIAKNTKNILMKEIKSYFLSEPHLSIDVKKEILKQNFVNYFLNGDFYKQRDNFSIWKEKADKDIQDIYDEEAYARSKIKRSHSLHGEIKDLKKDLELDNLKSKKINAVKIEIKQTDFNLFCSSIVADITFNATKECLELMDFENVEKIDMESIKLKIKEKEKGMRKISHMII